MKEALDVILDATQRANDILEKFKNLSNPNSSGIKTMVFVHEILDEVLLLMDHHFKKMNVKVCKIKSDIVEIEAYPTSLVQVLVNLTINSIHAMGSSGQIDYQILDLGELVEVRVRDYGPGIKQDQMQKVFEAFYTTKGEQGSGLGLPICKEIVEIEHGGTLSLSNHGVKGLEVVMTLPKNGGAL